MPDPRKPSATQSQSKDDQPTRRKALKRIAAASIAGGAAAATIACQPTGGLTAAPAETTPTASVGEARASFDAADPTLPHGGVKPSNTGEQNVAAMDELFRRARASKTDRVRVEMPTGTLRVAGTVSPSGKQPGVGENTPYWEIHFPNTRLVATGEPGAYMPLQGQAGGRYQDLDSFTSVQPGRPAPWNKAIDTVWIQNDEAGTLRKMRALFNCRNCEALHLSGMLTLDGGGLPELVALASTGGRGISGMKQGVVDILHIENAAVGLMACNFTSGVDTFTNAAFGVLQIKNGNKVGFVGQANHFDSLTINKLVLSCPYSSYLCNTHNIVIGSGFINVPGGSVSHHQLVLMGTNVRIECIYFHSGRGKDRPPSDGHILLCDNSVLDIIYHNDINASTATGCHLAMGKAPSGVICRSASLTARVDIRSVNGIKKAKGGGNPGMLWIDTAGGANCRRQVSLYMAAQRADYDLVRIDGAGSTNDKITLYDVRDDVNYGKTFKISDGKLELWA